MSSICLLGACGQAPVKGEINLKKSDYILPFKIQYNSAIQEIKGLEQEIAAINLEFDKYEDENSQKIKLVLTKRQKFNEEFDAIIQKIHRIQFDLESIIPGYNEGAFDFDSIVSPHSNEINSKYFKGLTNSVAAELALDINKLNKNLGTTKYLFKQTDTSGIYLFQEIIDPTSPNSPDPVYWEDQALIYAPMASCLAELRQIERRLIQTKASYYDYLMIQLQSSVYSFSDISPYMYSESSSIKVGESVKVKLGLKAWTNNEDFKYIINGDTIQNVRNGEALYNFHAKEKGRQKLNGIIKYTDPETGVEKQADFNYYIKVNEK